MTQNAIDDIATLFGRMSVNDSPIDELSSLFGKMDVNSGSVDELSSLFGKMDVNSGSVDELVERFSKLDVKDHSIDGFIDDVLNPMLNRICCDYQTNKDVDRLHYHVSLILKKAGEKKEVAEELEGYTVDTFSADLIKSL